MTEAISKPRCPRPRQTLEQRKDFRKILSVAWLYTVIAGMLNGISVLEVGTAVGYTSGAAVNAGRFLAKGDVSSRKILGICAMFYLGGLLAGLGEDLCDGDHVFEGRASPGMLLSSALVVLGTYAKRQLKRPVLTMQLWALSQGVMNGVSSRFSACPIRGSLVAGGQTDSALALASALLAWRRGLAPPPLRKVALNAVSCLGLLVGGLLSVPAHRRLDTRAALVPAGALAFSATLLPKMIGTPLFVGAGAPGDEGEKIGTMAKEVRKLE